MADKSFGLSIDGDRVTVVETMGDIAVSATSVAAGSLADSLDAALSGIKQKRNDPPMRVALIAPSTLLRRIDVTAALVGSRADFEDAVFAALPANREVSATAGAFFDREALVGDTVSAGAAVISPATRIEEVYAALGRRRAEVVASPLTLTGFDGIWFGVHHSVADVTLVVDGRTIAYRQLRAGGLSALLAVLGDPNVPELGQSRLLGALTATGPEDPLANVELGRYLRMLVSELSQTLDYWRRSGENVPATDQVLLYGPGASSPLAHSALVDAGLRPLVPESLNQALSYVPPASRAESLSAFCAAVTTGRHMPQVSFVNPLDAAIATASRKSRRRMFIVAGAGVVSVSLGLLVVKPIYEGWSTARLADRELTATLVEFDEKAELYHQSVDLETRRQIQQSALDAQPAWSEVYALVLASLPVGVDIDQVSATADSDEVTATVSVTMRGGSYGDLTRWLSKLATTDGVVEAWSTGFSQREDVASFVVSLRLKAQSTVAPNTAVEPTTTPTTLTPDVTPTDAPSTPTSVPLTDPSITTPSTSAVPAGTETKEVNG
jgi:Tfp pilus assembly protein PilN